MATGARWAAAWVFAVAVVVITGLGPAQAQDKKKGADEAKPQAAIPGAAWSVGFATTKITPEKPVLMAGYASRTDPSRSVAGDLYVKAMAITPGSGGGDTGDSGGSGGSGGILVTADLIGFRADITEEVAKRIMQSTGLRRDQLLFNASHTHSGPDLSIKADDVSKSEGHANTFEYIQKLKDQIVATAEAAWAARQPARLSWGSGVAKFVMNRREPTATGGIKLGVNPRGPTDRTVPVLRVDDADGKLRGLVFGTACHNTTLTGGNYAIHGDYAGAAQAHIEKHFPGAGVTAMFMIGCGGDANPYPRNTLENAEQHGKELGEEVVRVLETKFADVRPPLKTFLKQVDLPLKPVPSREKLEEIARSGVSYEKFMAARMIVELEQGRTIPETYRAPVALWQFGEDLTLVGISGETTVGYVHLVERELGPLKLWVAGYCNNVFGYLPTADVIEGGGYETRGLYWGGLGVFTPRTQDAVIEAVRDMANEAGRRRE